MKISLNWLNDYIDIKKYKPEDLADVFTSLGIEVETIEHVSTIEGDVVVGEILTAKPHPNADSLQICQVDVGRGEPLDIVCGGANARKGIKVAAALAGSKLPGDFKIKASKIRGEKSAGMLCGETEIGVGLDDSGIMELDSAHKLGSSIAEIYGLSDVVFELGLTPNRADCNGYIGLARDLSAKLGLPLKQPEINQNAHSNDYKTSAIVSVEIDQNENCGRFCALAVNKVKIGPSPMWLQRRLEMSGMRAVNLVVDATNYVMLEYGQPIHAYDRRDIAGAKIVVRDAVDNETVTTLDGQQRVLRKEDIVICDAENVIGVAGIMGGENSEVKDDTSEIVIEVASFHPVRVRKTSKRLAIHSEASHRFERGTDIEACDVVCHRVAGLIATLLKEVDEESKVVVSGELIDNYPNPVKKPMIALRVDRLRKISGDFTYESKQVTSILDGLGITLMDQKDDRLLFEIPTWRHDVHREIDLIEEVMRVHGFENLKKSLPVMDIQPLAENRFIRFNEQIRAAFASRGFCETMSFPFVSDTDLKNLGVAQSHPLSNTLKLKNPIVSDENQLQPTVVLGLIKALERNRRQGEEAVMLFECARAYFANAAQKDSVIYSPTNDQRCFLSSRASEESRPIEIPVIAAILGQPKQGKSWRAAEVKNDFYTAKAICVNILRSLGLSDAQFSTDHLEEIPFLHPGASSTIRVRGREVGYLGELHPKVAQAFGFDFDSPPVVMELFVERLLKCIESGYEIDTTQFKFPPTTRDLAFVIDETVQFAAVDEAFASFKKRNMKHHQLFDLYAGDNLKPGHKSMAFNIAFQSNKRTLNDKEVDKEIDLLLSHLKDKIGAELR